MRIVAYPCSPPDWRPRRGRRVNHRRAARPVSGPVTVAVTGMDGVVHEVSDVELVSSADRRCCWAVCGELVVPAPLVAAPNRRCVGCAAAVAPPEPAVSSGGYSRSVRRAVASWLRRTQAATSGNSRWKVA